MPPHESLEGITTSFIPQTLPAEYRTKPRYFTRKTKLTAEQTIGFVLSSVASGMKNGIRSNASHFLTNQCVCPLLSDYQQVHFTNVQKTRYKISDKAFQKIFSELIDSVYTHWTDKEYNFDDMAVVAFDGSQFTLPGSKEIRDEFDEDTPILKIGGRYFPQALVMTAFDVFRKIPIARTISHTKGSERTELLKMLNDLIVKSLVVLDRGYYGFEVFNRIIFETPHDLLAKVPMNSSFNEVRNFVATGKSEGVITINPTKSYLQKVKSGTAEKVEKMEAITLRIIRTKLGEEEFVLLTSLLDTEKHSTDSIIKLYQARWEVENYYRDEKMWLLVEDFMSESVLGVKQELFATMIMSIVTRVSLYLEELKNSKKGVPQFYNAITSMARAVPRMIALGVERCKIFLQNLLDAIILTRYYPSKVRRSFERISRKPHNKWKASALTKIKNMK